MKRQPLSDGQNIVSEFCFDSGLVSGIKPSWMLPVEGPFSLLPETRLWIYDSSSVSVGDGCSKLSINELSTEDQERFFRYRSEKKRREFLISRTVIASVLREEFGNDSTEIRIARDPVSGCLSLRNIEQQDVATFSLTHSGSVTAVVLGEVGVPVGVDLEAGRVSGSADRLSELTLSGQERLWFDALPFGIRRECLQQTWTIKESIWKTFGTRMGSDLRAIETTPVGRQSGSGGLIRNFSETPGVQWEVQCFSAGSRIDTYGGIQRMVIRHSKGVSFCGAVSRFVQRCEICPAW